jgi:UDP-N-acetylglucosamine 1-carboxyvinyltransferase
MDRIRIVGGKPLKGRIRVSGAKNAALPLMAAALLTEEPLRLENLPDLADIRTMASLLEQHGVAVSWNGKDGAGRAVSLKASPIANTRAPYELVRRMRASVLVLGPLVARLHRADVSLPGGCAIGSRPIDLHLKGLERMGAEIELAEGYVKARAPDGLKGAEIVFPDVSVGATENLLMAATLARGETKLVNAAREPEISDLCQCLAAMGARIDGAGTSTITIHGVDQLGGAVHRVIPDRIESGTYLMAAGITDGDIELLDTRSEHLGAVIDRLRASGMAIRKTARGLRASRRGGRLGSVDVTTAPFPGFPTDLQAQMMAVMSVAKGTATITETIFENRFMHVSELVRMGARIDVLGGSASVRGRQSLAGAEVMATDLRASVSLVLAGLAAEGETIINRVYHLDRGYGCVEEKLAACGAEIARLPDRVDDASEEDVLEGAHLVPRRGRA